MILEYFQSRIKQLTLKFDLKMYCVWRKPLSMVFAEFVLEFLQSDLIYILKMHLLLEPA